MAVNFDAFDLLVLGLLGLAAFDVLAWWPFWVGFGFWAFAALLSWLLSIRILLQGIEQASK